MKVTFLTQGELGDWDRQRIAEVLWRYMIDPDVEEMIFGFTEETMAGAAYAMSYAAGVRDQAREDPRALVLTSVVPHRVTSLRAEAQHAIARGDQVIELAAGEGPYGYNCYASRVVETVRDCGQVVLFWDGNFLREPWDTHRWLRTLAHFNDAVPLVTPRGNILAPVIFEHVQLQGPPTVHKTAEARRGMGP